LHTREANLQYQTVDDSQAGDAFRHTAFSLYVVKLINSVRGGCPGASNSEALYVRRPSVQSVALLCCCVLSCPCVVQAGDSSPEELAQATQLTGALLPGKKTVAPLELVKVTEELQQARAYGKLRLERVNARLQGIRKKRAAEAEKESKDAKA
jgi:hypothetical protein